MTPMGLARKLRTIYRDAGYIVSVPKLLGGSMVVNYQVLDDCVTMRVERSGPAIQFVGDVYACSNSEVFFVGAAPRGYGREELERELQSVLES